MGIIRDAELNSTGLNIRTWKIAILEKIAEVKALKAALLAQKASMIANEIDFTEDDRTEMAELVQEVRDAISSI